MEKQFKKTIGEWLIELTEPYRTQALVNTSSFRKSEMEISLKEAVHGAFPWYDSKEGSQYWSNVYDNL